MAVLVVFDVGGTLIGAKDMFHEAALRLGNTNLSSDIRDEFWRIISNNYSFSEEQALILSSEVISEREGLDASSVAGLMHDVFITNSTLFPFAFDVLSRLKNEGVHLVIASDSDNDLLIEELRKHSVLDFFDDVVTSSIAQSYKPSDLFVNYLKSVLEKYNYDELFFVGDSDVDILTAKKIGAKSVFFSKNSRHKLADFNISSLDELNKIVL